MAQVVLRFVTETDIVSTVIREVTWCEYSHVEFVTDDGRHCIGSRHSGGVQIRAINYAKFSAEVRYAIELTPDQSDKLVAFLKAQIGKPYDTTAVIGIGLHRDWREDDSWFCSELVAAAFEHAGLPLLNAPTTINRVTPRDLFMSPYIKTPLAA